MEIASLSVGFDGNLSGFERAIGRASGLLTQFEAQGSRAGRAFDNGFGTSVSRTAQQVGNSLDQLNNRIALLTQLRSLSLDTSVIARTNRELADLQARASQLQNIGLPAPSSGASSGLLSYAGGLLSVGAALGYVKQGLGVIADYERLDAGLKAASTSTTDYARSQQFALNLADQLGVSNQALAGSYKGLKAATNDTSLEGKETERIFRAVVSAGAALKLSNDDVQGSLRAITQIMATGTVQSDELKNELGNRLPGSVKLLADALGVGTKELFKMLEQVLSEDALPKLATQLEKTYGSQAQDSVNGMVGGKTRLVNQVELLTAEFGKTSNIDSFFGKVTNGLANALKGVRELSKDQKGGGIGDFLGTALSNAIPGVGAAKVLSSVKFTKLEDATGRANAKQEFSGKDFAGRAAQLAKLKADIDRSEADLARRSKDTVIPSFQMERERQALESKKQLLVDLRRENLLLAKGEQERARSSASIKSSVKVDPLADLEKQKKQYENDVKAREALIRARKPVSSTITNRIRNYEADTKRVEDITKPNKGGRATQAKDTYLSSYDLLTKKLAELKKQAIDLDLADKVVPNDLLNQIDGLSNKLERANGLFTKLKKIGDVPELAIRGGDKKEGRLLSSNPQATKLINADSELTKDGLVDPKKLGVNGIDQVIKSLYDGNKRLLDAKEETRQLLAQSRAQLGYDSANMLAGIGEAIGKGENPLKSALQGILDLLGGYLIQLGTALLLSSAKLLAAAPLTFGITLAPGLGQSLAGAGLIVGGAAVKALGANGFATGGHVTGPGSDTSDSIPAFLSAGEYVIKAAAVRKIGIPALNALNQGIVTQRALGGAVGYSPTRFDSPAANIPVERFKNLSGGNQRIEVVVGGKITNRGSDQELILARRGREKKQFGRP